MPRALSLLVCLTACLSAQTRLADYLPDDVTYDPAVPTPQAVLGFEVGAWHVRHDQLVRYCEALAEASPRVALETYAHSHERRPLLLLTITRPERLARIDEVRRRHLDGIFGAEPTEAPVIAWMGYSVHGDESSGANAALLLAYHLAAAQGPEIDALLDDLVVLLDPCLNPDGLSRFAQWANSHRGVHPVADPDHREHRQGWPSGRTNHYWFDLNRDWLLAVHPESRGRLERFHAWKPQLLTDFHEMGPGSTYFFQPGIPSRQNPLTPARNLELTRAIARFHAEALDARGQPYYTEESFDDFYYGKGSTYPDAHGSIGILFEQASARGHVQETPHGELTFARSIANQLATSFSSLAAARALGPELRAYQRDFYQRRPADTTAAWVFGSATDPAANRAAVELLLRHQIEVHALSGPVEADGHRFLPGSAYLVPSDQFQGRLARALFETRTRFADNTFYDVSAWTLPLALGLPYAPLDTLVVPLGERLDAPLPARGGVRAGEAPVAWLLPWTSSAAPRALSELLQADLRVRVATRPFSGEVGGTLHDFAEGTVVIPVGIQELPAPELRRLIDAVGPRHGVELFGLDSGLTPSGVDIGSPSLAEVPRPRPLLVVGEGVSAYEAGEAWHQLDLRYALPLTMVEAADVAGLELERYTHILLVDGGYGSLPASDLRAWVRAGGVLIASRGGAQWAGSTILQRSAEELRWDPLYEKPKNDAPPPSRQRYGDYEQMSAEGRIGGAIVAATVDSSHPLGYGIPSGELAFFQRGTRFLRAEDDPFASPLMVADPPLLAGFISERNRQRLVGSAAASAVRQGRGVVVRLSFNPLFRGIWLGTERVYANALFFGAAIKRTGSVDLP